MNNHQTWEKWASRLHGEQEEPAGDPCENENDRKEWARMERIYGAREEVGHVLRFKSPDKAWNEFKRRLAPTWQRELLKYAAVFILAAGISGFAFWKVYSPSDNAFTTVMSPNGQISTVSLSDGTTIWLNSGSKLKYNDHFNNQNREVFLEGEAFFSVTKDKNNPFIVHAGEAEIRVTGTEFNVQAYGNESTIETTLIEGKVQFHSPMSEIDMMPGQHVLFTKTTGKIETTQVNPAEYTAWKAGKIYFNNESLENLVLRLERWYEVQFVFKNAKIRSYRFSGVINKERSLEYTLGIIEEINKISFQRKGEQILILDK
ncbi:MAG: FecR family protein [Mangrovibacterium sp.]